MNSKNSGMDRHAKTLRAWQLAILRFAVTLDNADRLAVLMIAAEIDGLRPSQDNKSEFRFFRATSAEICAAILQPTEHTESVLQRYLAQIDDDRLKRSFAAAIEIDRHNAFPASKPGKRNNDLWAGLSPRRNQMSRL